MNNDQYKNLLIIGAAKSGTTYLFDNLINHPKIIGADHPNTKKKIWKEPKLLLRPDINKEKYIEAFQNNARKKTLGNILIDGSTTYTKWPQNFLSPTIFEKISDEYLCIYILRDPIDRFESHINFIPQRRKILNSNLEKILDLPLGKLSLDIGNYAMQLFGYKDMFAKGKLLIIDFNDLINNPKKSLELICENIKIDFHDLPQFNLKEISNKTSSYMNNNPIILDRLPFLRKSVYKLIPQVETREKITKTYHKIMKSKGYPKRSLSDSEKFKLAQLYKPSLIQLKEEFGINYFEKSWKTIKNYL